MWLSDESCINVINKVFHRHDLTTQLTWEILAHPYWRKVMVRFPKLQKWKQFSGPCNGLRFVGVLSVNSNSFMSLCMQDVRYMVLCFICVIQQSILLPWRWRRQSHKKHWEPLTKLYCVITQKAAVFCWLCAKCSTSGCERIVRLSVKNQTTHQKQSCSR